VRIDPAQVQQILFNLVLNARDAMPKGGAIEVKTGHGALPATESGIKDGTPAVFLAVKDSGCGMNAETRSRLFEPFFTTKANGRGTGLGLTTISNIVKENHGAIQVESESGEGTNFTVFLPRVMYAKTGTVESRFSPGSVKETILVLEDNVAIRGAVHKILSESGYVVLEAGSGPEALAVAQGHVGEIDLLLADIDMPGMSGHETARQLVLERSNLRVLYMSGYEPHGKSEATVFFKKPFTSSALLEKLREILESRNIAKKSEKRKREKS
jgi:CheY-like chemotaxis protein